MVNEFNKNLILVFNPRKHLEEDKLVVTLDENNCLINEIILFHNSEKDSWDQIALHPKKIHYFIYCDFSLVFQACGRIRT